MPFDVKPAELIRAAKELKLEGAIAKRKGSLLSAAIHWIQSMRLLSAADKCGLRIYPTCPVHSTWPTARWGMPVAKTAACGTVEFTEWAPDGHLRHSSVVRMRDNKRHDTALAISKVNGNIRDKSLNRDKISTY
jgi:hypothetical protein